MAYYPRQVEKTHDAVRGARCRLGEAPVRSRYDAEELEVLDEFVAHGRAIRAERARAGQAGEPPDFVPWCDRGAASRWHIASAWWIRRHTG